MKGKSPQERAEDFARLNYLLQYLKDDYDPETCPFPEPTDKPGYCEVSNKQPGVPTQRTQDNEKRIRIERIKAQAKLKMLELLKV